MGRSHTRRRTRKTLLGRCCKLWAETYIKLWISMPPRAFKKHVTVQKQAGNWVEV